MIALSAPPPSEPEPGSIARKATALMNLQQALTQARAGMKPSADARSLYDSISSSPETAAVRAAITTVAEYEIARVAMLEARLPENLSLDQPLEIAPSDLLADEQTTFSEPTAAEKRFTGATLGLASFIAAGARQESRGEWIAEQISGEAGELHSPVERLRFAVGLVHAAVRIRSGRITEPFVGRIDKIIRSEGHTRRAIAIVEITVVLYVFHAQGLAAVIADAESFIAIGGLIYGAARWRRKVLHERDAIAGVPGDDE